MLMSVEMVKYDPACSRFLNALIREWGGWRIVENGDGTAPQGCTHTLCLLLPASHAEISVPVMHHSMSGSHAFAYPMHISWDGGTPKPVTLPELAILLMREPDIGGRALPEAQRIFLTRVLDSAGAIAEVSQAAGVERPFAAGDPGFIEAEKALRFGHAVHPSPRSRDEFTNEDSRRYGPEYGNAFSLRWWAVDPVLLAGDSAAPVSAAQAARSLVALDPALVGRAEAEAGKELMPLHPWQAARLMQEPSIDALMRADRIRDLGLGDPQWRATTSLRTVYSADADWMLKFSLSLRLTNSRRLVEEHECARGLSVYRLLAGPVGQALEARCPGFHVMGEPAWLALRAPDGSIIKETMVSFRENPFRGAHQPKAAVLAALCERHQDDRYSHLADLVRRIAKAEGEAPERVAERWLGRFLQVAIAPFLIAQGDFGLLFGAHQQNLVLGLREGWPDRLYFRDCQGTGYVRSFLPRLREHLPEAGAAMDHVFGTQEAARIVGYYLFVNGAFPVVGALAAAGLGDEDRLFARFRAFVERLAAEPIEDRTCLDYLLSSPTIGAKGNFMISLGNINENTDVTDPLAGYVQLPNPLAKR
ncbi:IucA/IucC family protein [Nitratireductor thuwali]|uniref:N(2)-citryl-N(6)-acetyl-N(6)-hydroxylysine synthase n=1 Tax=Nitratireductor thuwali TaxID=2267699 RepID=A0ABY5MH69_9HYPH|nr:N(2)-citryl-N(6)-acetyl-N(6)-hydroxylysine synthase [Nitratireductor thuwali]